MSQDKWRGHLISLNENLDWIFIEDACRVKDDPYRLCKHCKIENTPEGHDGCLGILPGVMNACCGHGNDNESYVQFPDGKVIRGEKAISFININKKAKP